MDIHEYQAKGLLKKFNIPTLHGKVSNCPDEAKKIALEIGGNLWVVKAQIHAGGRGKGGGVKIAKSVQEVYDLSNEILGMNLVTHQTSKEGKKVNHVLIESGCDIKKEYYIAFVINRENGGISLIASSEGGMDIEEVSSKTPELIHTIDVDINVDLCPFQARKVAFLIGIPDEAIGEATKCFMNLYDLFVKKDCSLLEINPLVLDSSNKILALDAKMSFDTNALYRHEDILKFRDVTEEDPTELEASKYGLAFIKLDGNIGCLVNGAGLAMGTMDIIKLHGGSPANFLDVGGGANSEKVEQGFKLILQDKNVKAILVNIFGGIMKCDTIANGIIAACKALKLDVPLVVRLEGNNVEKGKQLLNTSGLKIIAAKDLEDAAVRVVESLGEK